MNTDISRNPTHYTRHPMQCIELTENVGQNIYDMRAAIDMAVRMDGEQQTGAQP